MKKRFAMLLALALTLGGAAAFDSTLSLNALAEEEYEYTETIEQTHTHSYTSEITTPSTCVSEGTLTHICECGDSYTESLPLAQHNYTSKTVAPTYTAQGYTEYTCTVCGDSYKDNFTPTLTRTALSDANVSAIPDKSYTGSAVKPSPAVTVSGKVLKAGTDYTLSYKNASR